MDKKNPARGALDSYLEETLVKCYVQYTEEQRDKTFALIQKIWM